MGAGVISVFLIPQQLQVSQLSTAMLQFGTLLVDCLEQLYHF